MKSVVIVELRKIKADKSKDLSHQDEQESTFLNFR